MINLVNQGIENRPNLVNNSKKGNLHTKTTAQMNYKENKNYSIKLQKKRKKRKKNKS